MLRLENNCVKSVEKMCYQFCNIFLNIFQKLYPENFTGKNAPFSCRKYEIDEIKMMTLSHANFCKRIHEIAAVLHFSHLRM